MPCSPRKAAQTIGFFALQTEASSVSVRKAVKLVYLADRESVRRRGHPIQDEARVSMPHGPVNSATYEYLKGAYDPERSGWSAYLADKADHEVGLARNDITLDDLDELSQSEIQILSDVWERFGGMDRWALRDWTHDAANVPEWKDPNGSSHRITLREIMDAVGMDHAKERSHEYQSLQKAQDILASL